MKRFIELKDCIKEYDTKDVFSVLNREDAVAYIGKKGYFADCLFDLDHALQFVDQDYWCKKLDHLDFNRFDDVGFIRTDGYPGRYFLPAEKVKVKVKDEA